MVKILKNFPPSTKQFEALYIAWIHRVDITPEDDAQMQAMLYEAEIRPPPV